MRPTEIRRHREQTRFKTKDGGEVCGAASVGLRTLSGEGRERVGVVGEHGGSLGVRGGSY